MEQGDQDIRHANLELGYGLVSRPAVLKTARNQDTAGRTPRPAAAQSARPFGLPFADPPGPSTWLLVQAYGNTTTAFRWRLSQYGAGQGLHFGLDFSARCGTTVVAIGAIIWLWPSPPRWLAIGSLLFPVYYVVASVALDFRRAR